MERINKKLGFGLMRLPMKDGEVDIEQTCLMVDEFIKAGFNYFDTAHGYLSGKSEKAAKTCLTSRYPRESFILTNKLTDEYFKTNDDIRPFFENQLELCGVDYFDFYLMHAQNKARFRYFKERNAYETAIELKKEGKIRHFGISFHDRAEVLDAILSEYPQIEVVQIQFNYLDYDDIGVQSRKCYEVCRKHNKPVLVMEPVKGGSLVKLPDEAQRIFASLNGGSPASYAIRFGARLPGDACCAFGHGDIDDSEDNISYMSDFKPLDRPKPEPLKGSRCLQGDGADSVHRLPLLHGRLSEAYCDSRLVCAYECETAASRLECKLLLLKCSYRTRKASLRLHKMRKMRGLMSSKSSDSQAAGRCCGRI